MNRRAFVLSSLAAAAPRARAQAKAKAQLRMSAATGPAFALGRAAERWAQLVDERGAFATRVFFGAVLAARDPLRELGALRDGGADCAVGSALAWSAQLPAFGVYGLPWLAADAARAAAIAGDRRARAELAVAAMQAGVVVVAVAPLGERVVSTAKAPLLVPADYRGLRLRAPTIPLVMQTLATLGARPEASPLADAQAAFAAGTLDGQEGPASTLAATRIGASGQRFVTRTGAFHDAMVFAMRGAVWAQWNEEVRAMLRETAQDAARDAAPLAREERALAELGKQGVAVVRPTPAQRDALRAAVEPVWREWIAPIGAELVAAAAR